MLRSLGYSPTKEQLKKLMDKVSFALRAASHERSHEARKLSCVLWVCATSLRTVPDVTVVRSKKREERKSSACDHLSQR